MNKAEGPSEAEKSGANEQPEAVWKKWLSYPQHVKPETAKILDVLCDVIQPIGWEGKDRYSNMTDLLEIAEQQGLITPTEHRKIRSDIAAEI